jgi:hypothetical protein
MSHRGPGVPLPGTVIHQRTLIAKPAGTPTTIISPPPLGPTPKAVVVTVTPVTPTPSAPSGVRIVHHHPVHHHAHSHGMPKLVGVHKSPHVHHARVLTSGTQHGRGAHYLPAHGAVRAHQPSLRAIATSHHTSANVPAPHAPHGTQVPTRGPVHPAHPTTHVVHKGPARRPF